MIEIELIVKGETPELFSLPREEVTVATEKNFNGDLTTIELYISEGLNILFLIVSLIKSYIKQKKVSSLVLDKDKIELHNVSEETIMKVLDAWAQRNSRKKVSKKGS